MLADDDSSVVRFQDSRLVRSIFNDFHRPITPASTIEFYPPCVLRNIDKTKYYGVFLILFFGLVRFSIGY